MRKLRVLQNALKIAWRENVFKAWIFICVAGIVIGLLVGIGMTQLVLLVAIACMGWAMEVINTAVETLMDIVHPQYSEKVKIVKDLFALVPVFVYSSYVVSWLILVAPTIYERLIE